MRRALALGLIATLGLAGAAAAQDRDYGRDRDDRGGPMRGAQPPPGDYFRTCRSISTYGYGRDATMTAECRDDRGRWRQTSVRFAGCDRIENRDGNLVCRGGGDGARPPGPPWGPGGGFRPPGYGSQITLFSAPNFGGQAFQSRSEYSNLPRQFNDKALSLRIEGRGVWQVCADSDFRGRCQIFDRDVADLRPYGLGYAVSSVRPAR